MGHNGTLFQVSHVPFIIFMLRFFPTRRNILDTKSYSSPQSIRSPTATQRQVCGSTDAFSSGRECDSSFDYIDAPEARRLHRLAAENHTLRTTHLEYFGGSFAIDDSRRLRRAIAAKPIMPKTIGSGTDVEESSDALTAVAPLSVWP